MLPTLFSIDTYGPLLFCEAGVFKPSSDREAGTPLLVGTALDICPPEQGRLWVLVDLGKEKKEPPDSLISGNVFVVQTTSPDQVRYEKWIKVRMQHHAMRLSSRIVQSIANRP